MGQAVTGAHRMLAGTLPAGAALADAQQCFGLLHQATPIFLSDVCVVYYSQKIERHVEGCASRDGFKGGSGVWEIAAVLTEEVTDERLRRAPMAGCRHEGVLDLGHDITEIKRRVAVSHRP